MQPAINHKDWDYVRNHLASIDVNKWCQLIAKHAPIDIIIQLYRYQYYDRNLLTIALCCENLGVVDYLLNTGLTPRRSSHLSTVIVTNHQQITTNKSIITQLVELTRDLTMFRDFYNLCHF